MSPKLKLVVNNKDDKEVTTKSKLTEPAPKITQARWLLSQASDLLGNLGGNYRDVSSLIDECNDMLGRKDCEPYCNQKGA